MTHVDDLYEPGDDREPEPCDWYPAPEPVDLEEVEQRLERLKFLAPPFGMAATRAELNGTEDLHDLAALIGQEVHGLIAEVREARQRIAEWEALPTRERWTVTGGRDVQPGQAAFEFATYDLADRQGNDAKQVWRRMLSIHPWEPIDLDRPL
jgi:hypothetical protein